MLSRLPHWINPICDANKEMLIERLVHGDMDSAPIPHWVKETIKVSALVNELYRKPPIQYRVLVGPDGQDQDGYLAR